MQRLNPFRRLRRRPSEESGATAVLFALLLVPMLGFTAIAVDIGAVYAERTRLQTAADAAAFAVAQDCARGACGNAQSTAEAMIASNETGVSTAPVVLASSPPAVTVTDSKATQHWFAPALGIDATQVHASATVSWGSPQGGTAVLPLTFSWCEFQAQTGGGLPSGTAPRTILFTKTSGTGCTGPSGLAVPGGFAYLDTSGGKCQATSSRNGTSTSSTGNSVPSPCSPTDFSALVGQTVLLPLYDQAGATGNNAWYHVYAYAAFKLTGYYLGGQFHTSPQPCTGNARCVAGYFTRFVDLSDRFTYSSGGPDTGAEILRLVR